MLDDAVPVLEGKAPADKSFSAEIILVDDGSKDDTCSEYVKYVKSSKHNLPRIHFKLLKLANNCGKGRAVSEVSIPFGGSNTDLFRASWLQLVNLSCLLMQMDLQTLKLFKNLNQS